MTSLRITDSSEPLIEVASKNGKSSPTLVGPSIIGPGGPTFIPSLEVVTL